MHQTTVRFTRDLWYRVEMEARRSGVSAAQYVRDATLARLVQGSLERGEPGFTSAPAPDLPPDDVMAQARLARGRAQSLRDDAKETAARARGQKDGAAYA